MPLQHDLWFLFSSSDRTNIEILKGQKLMTKTTTIIMPNLVILQYTSPHFSSLLSFNSFSHPGVLFIVCFVFHGHVSHPIPASPRQTGSGYGLWRNRGEAWEMRSSHEIYIFFRRNCALYVLITMMTYINGVWLKVPRVTMLHLPATKFD